MHLYIHTLKYTCIHMHAYRHIHEHMYMCTHKHTKHMCTYTSINLSIHKRSHMYMCTHKNIHIYTITHMCTQACNMCTHKNIYIYTLKYTHVNACHSLNTLLSSLSGIGSLALHFLTPSSLFPSFSSSV